MEITLDSDTVGIFEAIDSFVVKTQMKYCVIGKLKKGEVKKGYFLNIAFNSSFGMTTRITQIDEIEFASNRENCILISSESENLEILDLLLSMNVGVEPMKITISGQD